MYVSLVNVDTIYMTEKYKKMFLEISSIYIHNYFFEITIRFLMYVLKCT
jgi:hypothetical protein